MLLDVLNTHISQFTETKKRIGKRQGQADEAHVDEEVAALRSEYAIVLPCECGEDQSPQNTERSSVQIAQEYVRERASRASLA
jgi:hypothetical protein